jgi:hypothetical protein
MTTIPFYNHYYDSFSVNVPTSKFVKLEFKVEEINVEERGCLCQQPSDYRIDSPVVLVHGERNNDKDCYRRIYEIMRTNPNTVFYIWAVTSELDISTNECLDINNHPPNCKFILKNEVLRNIEEIKAMVKGLEK